MNCSRQVLKAALLQWLLNPRLKGLPFPPPESPVGAIPDPVLSGRPPHRASAPPPSQGSPLACLTAAGLIARPGPRPAHSVVCVRDKGPG